MVLVGAELVMNGLLAVFVNGLYCKTGVKGISSCSVPTVLTLSMAYSFFIWGSAPRQNGTFEPWEIYNVIPDLDSGKKCPEHLAQSMLRDAKQQNPGVQFEMTDRPNVPGTLSGQCSDLY